MATFDRIGGPGTVTTLSAEGGYALLPAHDDDASRALCGRLHAGLDGSVWLAAGWRRTSDLADAKRHVDDILALALALQSEPGVRWLDDFPVEYAALRTPAVAELLSHVISPVVSRPLLLLTLEVLIGADGNRSQAARRLAVHYSTIDYRLRRIEALTGHSPLSTTGLSLLSTAFAVHVLTNRDGRLAASAAASAPQPAGS
jgi:sugar diacid utilization regulator